MNSCFAMDLSIIIVNWNSKEFLRDCLASIEAQTEGISYEIIVIDSGSFDGCDQMLRECFLQVRFIQSESNVGFARANNMAFGVSVGECILFLNPDTTLVGPAVNVMLQHLKALPDAGAVGCRLLNADGSIQSTCVRAFPTIVNQFFESEILRRWFPRSQLWGMRTLFQETENPREVDAVSGACLMIKRAVFESIGQFSEDYFMYSEDIDICYKARHARSKTYYVPTAVIVHFGGKSTSKRGVSNFVSVMMLESRWRFFVKTRSLAYGRLFRLSIVFASIARIGMAVLVWPFSLVCGGGTSIEGVIKKWTAKLRWTVGGESWVKRLQQHSK